MQDGSFTVGQHRLLSVCLRARSIDMKTQIEFIILYSIGDIYQDNYYV